MQLPPSRESAVAVAPVLRLDAAGAMPLGEKAVEAVLAVLKEALRRTKATEVQIDFDCPDRRLEEYARFLAECRHRISPAKLSATALAGWSRLPAFGTIQASVDALVPMFYDLQPDRPEDVRAGRVLPILDASEIARQLDSWRSCRIPWFAGLPTFARVTIFDPTGGSRGHLREWDWDSISFNPAVISEFSGSQSPGISILRAAEGTTVERTPVRKNEMIACRTTDLEHLRKSIRQSSASGASGIVLFRLPGEGSPGGWSLNQLGAVIREQPSPSPNFQVRLIRNGLELSNMSDTDLPPRLSGPAGAHDRGWQLEVESREGAVFREASPGEFANVFGHTNPEAPEPKRVPIPLAERLTFWLGNLRAGASRQTGLLQFAPGTDTTSLRWRVVGTDKNLEWHPVE